MVAEADSCAKTLWPIPKAMLLQMKRVLKMRQRYVLNLFERGSGDGILWRRVSAFELALS